MSKPTKIATGILVVLLLPFLYVASYVPITWLVGKGYLPLSALYFFEPLWFASGYIPGLNDFLQWLHGQTLKRM